MQYPTKIEGRDLRAVRSVAAALLGQELRRTREKAHLTQAELAVCIGRSAGVVEAAELGRIAVTPRYIARVLEVCERPELWMPTTIPPRGPLRD